MNNNNNKEFITREIFDANILAIREAIAASEARCERMTAEMNNKYEIVQIRLDSIDRRIDNIEKSQDRFFRNMGFALTGMTLLFTMLQIFLR